MGENKIYYFGTVVYIAWEFFSRHREDIDNIKEQK